MNLHELSASLQQQGVKHRVVIAKPEQVHEESKLREFFEHFINVFPKFRLWNVKDLKAGAKYGLTTIKPFLAGDTNQAQVLPMAYQVNPVLTVEKFPHSETHTQAKKLVRETYGPHLKKTLDAVYGLRSSLRPIETKDEYGAVVEFEDAGKPMRATLKITEWSEHGDETELVIYVTINNRRTSAVAAFAKSVEMSADVKRALDEYKQELAEALAVVGKPNAISDYIDKSKYIVFVDRHKSHNVWLDKATGIAYEGKSGPSCNLSRDIANIKDGPKARAKIIMQHMDDVRFAPRDVLDSMPAFRNR
jgi:hypothetical protein